MLKLAVHGSYLHLLIDSYSSLFRKAEDTIGNLYITVGKDLTTHSCGHTGFALENSLTWTDSAITINSHTSADILLATATGILVESASQMSISSSTVMLMSVCESFTASGTPPTATNV